ncbi:hypothetical protein GCM10010145_62630 [Streptomyces ruber]|uniref:non-specific serine/threonine protein kinase n=2 Tax=Streptomyces TaxID=1883 RepID=A0A918EZF4_9ACTN|nr:serine/threonine-protein kinase [Streptomyces ruber]GGQ84560.1 hypothetical protein GCM10010145_62630 [Streptomyces ruber]
MGEVFAGRYELVDPIGHGGVGAVWRAWDHRRRRYVAAKVLQQRDAHSLLRFVREQALRIDHPHVLAPTSWAADDDQVLFTMQLVAGGSLVNLVNDYGPLPPAFVCTLLDQLLSGLAAVHSEDVVHRDIKPANVLLEATGTARPHLRLSDFGIAMRLGEPRLTETNYVVGTPGYLAPEQMMGAEPDFPADLFAVGLVALYLLEGAKPDTRSLIEHFAAHGTPGPPKNIPEPLWQVVATLIQPDPLARFRTATGARKALAAAAELLPEPDPDEDETVEVFDQLGPLPEGFAPAGPLRRASGLDTGTTGGAPVRATGGTTSGADGPSGAGTGTGTGTGTGPAAGASTGTGTGTGTGTTPPALPATPLPRPPVTPPPMPSSAPPPTGSPHGSLSPYAAQGAVRLPPATDPGPPAVPPRPARAPEPSRPSTMSDTGSFHLPPPLPQAQSPVPAPDPQEQPRPHLAAARTPTARSNPAPAYAPLHADSTHTFSPQPLPPLDPVSPVPPVRPQEPSAAVQRHAHAAGGSVGVPSSGVPRHSRRRPKKKASRRRPGPPAKVAVPVLLLALLCFAVGFWALARL